MDRGSDSGADPWASGANGSGNEAGGATAGTGPGGSGTSGGNGGSSGDSSGSPTGGSEGDSASGDESGSGIRFDVAGESDGAGAEGGTREGCNKIDFLFVVDNSTSMGPFQAELQRNFSGLIDGIVNEIGVEDYQIMVVDSDAEARVQNVSSSWQHTCEYWCTWQDPGGDDSVRRICDGEECAGVCESTLGGGRLGNMACGLGPDGPRFLTSEMGPDAVVENFECIVSKIYAQGDPNEKPFTAMAQAIGPLAAAGACNAGFVRDDAILVITVVSDDNQGWGGIDDSTSTEPGLVDGWYDAILQAKRGDPQAVVLLGLLSVDGVEPTTCMMGGPPFRNPNYLDLFDRFGEHAQIASVCEENYLPVFQAALPVIGDTCDDFVPPG